MRTLRYAILAVLAIALVTVALANRDPLTLRLVPAEIERLLGFGWQITLPAFVVLLAAMAAGILLGFVWEWVREYKHRAAAASERRERQRLENEVRKTAQPAKSGDDVLALLESR